jgi:hypothetical protein
MPSEMKRLRQLEDENGTGYRLGCLSAQSAAMEPSTPSRPKRSDAMLELGRGRRVRMYSWP